MGINQENVSLISSDQDIYFSSCFLESNDSSRQRIKLITSHLDNPPKRAIRTTRTTAKEQSLLCKFSYLSIPNSTIVHDGFDSALKEPIWDQLDDRYSARKIIKNDVVLHLTFLQT